MNNHEIAAKLVLDVDMFCVKKFDDGHRKHLGASVMGKPCNRQLWYSFRWVKQEKHSARVHRLFQRGHREEPFMTMMLKGIGCEVNDGDKSKPMKENGTYPQYRVSGVQGHFGGSLDAIVVLPASYSYRDPISFSYKTCGTGASFNNLSLKGLLLAKPEHHIQESIYCYKMGFKKYGYMSVNKNDDSLFIAIQDADYTEASRQEARAEKIIFSKEPPARIAENKSYFTCQYCDKHQICFDGVKPEKNCRSCTWAEPVDGGQWQCNGYKCIIPDSIIQTGCDNWQPIVNA